MREMKTHRDTLPQNESETKGRNDFRDAVRAIMRGEDIDSLEWQPQDLIREIVEWHEAGRPTVSKPTKNKYRLYLTSQVDIEVEVEAVSIYEIEAEVDAGRYKRLRYEQPQIVGVRRAFKKVEHD